MPRRARIAGVVVFLAGSSLLAAVSANAEPETVLLQHDKVRILLNKDEGQTYLSSKVFDEKCKPLFGQSIHDAELQPCLQRVVYERLGEVLPATAKSEYVDEANAAAPLKDVRRAYVALAVELKARQDAETAVARFGEEMGGSAGQLATFRGKRDVVEACAQKPFETSGQPFPSRCFYSQLSVWYKREDKAAGPGLALPGEGAYKKPGEDLADKQRWAETMAQNLKVYEASLMREPMDQADNTIGKEDREELQRRGLWSNDSPAELEAKKAAELVRQKAAQAKALSKAGSIVSEFETKQGPGDVPSGGSPVVGAASAGAAGRPSGSASADLPMEPQQHLRIHAVPDL